jgi:hypothetical protein
MDPPFHAGSPGTPGRKPALGFMGFAFGTFATMFGQADLFDPHCLGRGFILRTPAAGVSRQ